MRLQDLWKLLCGPMPLNDFPDYDEYWERRAQDSPAPADLHRSRLVAAHIPDGSSVVDIGCGDGAFLLHLQKTKPNCQLLGLDISPRGIDILRQRGLPGHVIEPGKPLRETIGPRQIDYVVLMEVIEHVHDAEALFAQALALNPRQLFVSIPNVGYFMHRLRLLFGRFPVAFILYHVKEHIRFWTVKDFHQWTGSFGCRVTAVWGQERTSNPLRLFLLRHFPALFAAQIVYRVEKPITS